MFSESTMIAASPAVQGVVENGAGKHAPHYRVEVDINEMTWGDNMIHVRFQLLIELADNAEADDPKLAANPLDTPEEAEHKALVRRARRSGRIETYKELMAGFGELTAFLDRVAVVYRDGVRCPTVRDVPQRFVREIMAAIGKAKAAEGETKN